MTRRGEVRYIISNMEKVIGVKNEMISENVVRQTVSYEGGSLRVVEFEGDLGGGNITLEIPEEK